MTVPFGGIYRGKRVLVTGHTGFKGSWLALWLDALGADVTGYALPPPTRPSLFRAARLERRVEHVEGDVRDGARLLRLLRRVRPHFVFHLAAQSLVRRSYAAPVLTMESNVLGTVNVLEAVRRAGGVRACLVITSDKCYENREWVYSYRENDPLGGHDPYSASKACAELVAAAYRDSFFAAAGRGGTAIATARAGNVVGGGDWAPDRIVPDCMRALARRRPVAVRNPRSVRPWQYVLDPLAGYLQLGERLYREGAGAAGAWNFGPSGSDTVPVADLVDGVVGLWGSGSWNLPSRAGAPAPHEAVLLKLDCTKAAHLLGWRSCYGLEDTLAATVGWYRAYYAGARGDVLHRRSLAALEEFATRAAERSLPWARPGARAATPGRER